MSIQFFSYRNNGKESLSEHFLVKDFASASYSQLYTDVILIDLRLVDILESIYKHFNCRKVKIVCAYRSAQHEIALKKTGTSFHNDGRAVDIRVIDKDGSYISACKLKSFLEQNEVYGLRIIDAKTLHIDTRIKAMKNMKI